MAVPQRDWNSLTDSSTVTALSPNTYEAYFPDDWCIGSVPHGGFVTTTFLRVANLHCTTTLAAQNQPDTLAVQINFLRRTQVGPALFQVREAKVGAATSVLHITLIQGTDPKARPPFAPGQQREEVVGYFTQANISSLTGLTIPGGLQLTPPPPAVDLQKLSRDADENWHLMTSRFVEFRKAVGKIQMHYPRSSGLPIHEAEQWMRLTNGERWTTAHLGYVADVFRFIVEDYKEAERRRKSTDPEMRTAHWYPTLLLNMEVKKPLPAEGVEWLYSRVRTKAVKNGRLDVELMILDEQGELVALSQHVCMILNAQRNIADRNQKRTEAPKL